MHTFFLQTIFLTKQLINFENNPIHTTRFIPLKVYIYIL